MQSSTVPVSPTIHTLTSNAVGDATLLMTFMLYKQYNFLINNFFKTID